MGSNFGFNPIPAPSCLPLKAHPALLNQLIQCPFERAVRHLGAHPAIDLPDGEPG